MTEYAVNVNIGERSFIGKFTAKTSLDAAICGLQHIYRMVEDYYSYTGIDFPYKNEVTKSHWLKKERPKNIEVASAEEMYNKYGGYRWIIVTNLSSNKVSYYIV